MSEVKTTSFATKLTIFWRKLRKGAKKAKNSALRGFARFVDPKLEPYRGENRRIGTQQPASATLDQKPTDIAVELKNAPESLQTPLEGKSLEIPQSQAELIEVLHNIPLPVLPSGQRKQLEAVLKLDSTPITELSLPADRIVYVDENEVLGPLTLDRLFRSGMAHFPVTNRKEEIIGCIHTTRLNSLDVKQSSKARTLLDPNICYAREDYTLKQALDTFLRNECFFLLIVDSFGKITGILNFSDLAEYLFGKIDDAGFLHDDDRLAVAKRDFPVDLEQEQHG